MSGVYEKNPKGDAIQRKERPSQKESHKCKTEQNTNQVVVSGNGQSRGVSRLPLHTGDRALMVLHMEQVIRAENETSKETQERQN
jgi:hypothetical protein